MSGSIGHTTQRLTGTIAGTFFLLCEPQGAESPRVIRRWRFLPEEVALAVPSETAARIREIAPSEDEAIKRIYEQRSHYLVAGHVKVDREQEVATVSITGMVRCVEEHVDLKPRSASGHL